MPKDRPYRGIFKTSAGTFVGLDFFAFNRGLALDHAAVLARDDRLTVVLVKRLATLSEYDAGTWYAVEKLGRDYYRTDTCKFL